MAAPVTAQHEVNTSIIQLVQDPWIKTHLEKHPELLWFAEGEVATTQEGIAKTDNPLSPSVQTFGKHIAEFDRTFLTLRTLQWIDFGDKSDHDELIDAQEANPLTDASFEALHTKFKTLSEELGLGEGPLSSTIEAALVLGDLGKCTYARAQFPEIQAPDHDDFEKEMLQQLKENPGRLKTYADLNPAQRDALQKASGIAHFGHIYHAEGGAEMFTGFSREGLQPQDVQLALLIHICDVAGAAGHINPISSLVLNEATAQGYASIERAIVKHLDNPQEAYQAYLGERAELLGLNKESEEDRFIAKVGAMLRLTTQEEGEQLRAAWAKVDNRDAIREELMRERKLTATYMPAVLNNLNNRFDLESALTIGLPLLQKGLELPLGSEMRHCFNALAGDAKRCSQEELAHGELQIDDLGNVSLKREAAPHGAKA